MSGGIAILPFEEEFLQQRLGDSGHVSYLFKYLTELGARSVLCEEHYVDRHYLDDFVNYYARSFKPIPAHCARFHFFAGDHESVNASLERAALCSADVSTAQQELQEKYLGFLVCRPLARTKIGRTVLKTYPVAGRRHYTVVRPYKVHIDGLELTVDGLAFQQQDGGAAVCASTALWSALQQVARVSGHRTPTPHAITHAAAKPFPARDGLGPEDMARALSSLGYIADYFRPGTNLASFRAQVVACLDSQLPVILLLVSDGEGHAVTVTGYSEPVGDVEVPYPGVAPVKMRGAAVEILYVHDDNLGPHAHYELLEEADAEHADRLVLSLRRGRKEADAEVGERDVDVWRVVAALVPKPDKLRVPVKILLSSVYYCRPCFDVLGVSGSIHYSVRFDTGVSYRKNLFLSNVDRAQLRKFSGELLLPRYVGVVCAKFGDDEICDFVFDVSDAAHLQNLDRLVAVVAKGTETGSKAAGLFELMASMLKVPCITGGSSPLRFICRKVRQTRAT